MKFLLLLLVVSAVCVFHEVDSLKREVLIGGLFHGDDDITQLAFKFGLERINAKARNFEFLATVRNISRHDSLEAQQVACELAAEGVDILFGPSSEQTSGVISSIAETLGIPHVIFHWKSKPLNGEKTFEHRMTLNLYPDFDILAKAYADVLENFSMTSYTIVYEAKENLIRLKNILQLHDAQSTPHHLMQLLAGNYGALLKEISLRGDTNVVLDLSSEKVVPFLMEAAEFNMLNDYNSYFITNDLDVYNLNFSAIPDLPSNLTCLRLVDTTNDELEKALTTWQQEELNVDQFPVEAGLVYDALQLFYNSLRNYHKPIPKNRTQHDCNNPQRDEESQKFFNFMKTQRVKGITGNVEFDHANGKRTDFQLDILEFAHGEFVKVGFWNKQVVVIDRPEDPIEEAEIELVEEIHNKTFVIAVRLEQPFLMIRKMTESETLVRNDTFKGNEAYEGYIVDLINKLQESLLFDYELQVSSDGVGSLDLITGKWNGMVGQLNNKDVDLAIADITITGQRRTVVDFSIPFMSLGIGLLYIKPVQFWPDPLSFLHPFGVDVWLYAILAYIGVSAVIFVLARISDEDWQAFDPRHHSIEDENSKVDVLKNIWNFKNCVWLAMTIMGQGCNILPKGLSTRLVTAAWWLLAIILTAHYFAYNLAINLTTSKMSPTLNDPEDLIDRSYIKFGAVYGGATMKFFRDSNFSTYQRMWSAMERSGDSFHARSVNEGIMRVKQRYGTYAFLMESPMLEYVTNRDCSLMQVGGLLNSNGFGIAFPKNSPYRKAFNEQLQNLSDSGVLDELKDKWWKSDIVCDDAHHSTNSNLQVQDIRGAVWLLILGCLVAFVFSICEFLGNIKKVAVEQKISWWKFFKSEVAFVMMFWIDTKPVAHQLSDKSKPTSSQRLRAKSLPETSV